MVQKLAGRLTFDWSGTGIRVDIPAKLDWTTAFLIVWLAGWTFGGRMAILKASTPETGSTPSLFLLVWLVGWACGTVFVSWTILWSFLGRIVLVLDPGQLELTWLLPGITVKQRRFATGEIRNLRFQPAYSGGRSRTPSSIRFEAADKTIKFASGLEDGEALALIEKMLGVYSFSKDRALEYLDLSR
jgi:hypothetical protein